MSKDQDFSAEDDAEGQVALDQAAGSEFRRLIDRLKAQEKAAKESEKAPHADT